MALSDYALCTVDEVKEYYQFPSKGSRVLDNDLIENLINRVTVNFHNYCGLDQFKSKIYTEFQDGNGKLRIYPYNYPIISITSIHIDGDWLFDNDTLISSSYYKIVDGLYISMNNNTFTKGVQNIKIVYTAGYETIPYDLKQACIEEVARKFKNKKNFDEIFRTIEGSQVSKVEQGLLVSTKEVLDNYIRNEIC